MPRIYLYILILLTVFGLGIRLFRFAEPPRYYFDEVYHAVTAKAYADNNRAAYDPFSPAPKEGTAYDWLHPPLAKLIQAGTIKIFGDTPQGWRLPSVIFGTAIIPATFLLAYVVFGPLVAVFAAAVIAFENLNLVMSRITMNDVFLTFFVIVAFAFSYLFILKRRLLHLLLSALFLGFAVGTKWTGFYAVFAVFAYTFFSALGKKKLDFRVFILLLVPPLLYIASYTQFFLQGYSFVYWKDVQALVHNLTYDVAKATDKNTTMTKKPYEGDFAKLHQQIWWYQNRRDLEHPYGTTPLFCVPNGLDQAKTYCPWVLDVRPVYFSYEKYGDDKSGYIYALGNPFVYWIGILAVSFLITDYLEKRKRGMILILLGYFIFWVPWIFSPRIMFMYHYLPAIPFMSIAIGYAIAKVYKSKYRPLTYVILGLIIFGFFYFYPITSGFPIKTQMIEKFMWLKTWR